MYPEKSQEAPIKNGRWMGGGWEVDGRFDGRFDGITILVRRFLICSSFVTDAGFTKINITPIKG